MKISAKVVRFATLALLLVLMQLSWEEIPVSALPDPSSTITEWTLPTALSNPFSVVVYGGKVYFTEESGNRIGRLDPITNKTTEWTVPTAAAGLRGTAIYGGKIWFTEYQQDKIGRLDPSTGKFTEWVLKGVDVWSGPYGIAVYKGKVYFTCAENKRIGCLDPSTNKTTEWDVPYDPAGDPPPWGLAIDSTGKVWFTRGAGGGPHNKISRLDPSTSTFREWDLYLSPGDEYSYPWHMTISSDGKVWFTEYYGEDEIGRLDPKTNKLTEWKVPTPVGEVSDPHSICEDAMGNIYFTEFKGNEIGKLKPKGGTTRTITDITQTIVTPTSYTSSSTSKVATPRTKTLTPKSTPVLSTVSGMFTEWDIPTANSYPTGIFTEDGTTFYFTEWDGAANKIAQFKPQYTFTEWDLAGTYGGSPYGITVYSGQIWFTRYDRISRLDPSTNSLREWEVPTYPSNAGGIVVSGGKVWFTEYDPPSNQIGYLDPSTDTFKEWKIPTSQSYPVGITVYGGKVWFLETWSTDGYHRIGRLDPSTDTFTEWTLPDQYYEEGIGIAFSGGYVWYTRRGLDRIGRLDPITNKTTEWKIPTDPSNPWGIVVSGGKVWFAEYYGNKIGRLDPSTSKFTEWTIPTTNAYPVGVAVYGGKVWFTESDADANKIGKLYPTGGKVTSVTPVSKTCPTTVTTKTPTTAVKRPVTTKLTPKKTDVTGSITGPFTEWLIPTAGSYSQLLAAPGGGEVWFTEATGNKIGMLG